MERILQLAVNPELCASMGARARVAYNQYCDKNCAIDQWQQVLNAAVELTFD